MYFKDRLEGGEKLVPKLSKYRNDPNALVIGLPRGGVVTAFAVAKGLNLPLDVVCPRKIGAPQNPELAIGAITETGEGIFDERIIHLLGVSNDYIRRTVEKEKLTAQKRLSLFRKNRPPLSVEGKTVILVDDGIATGATMKAAIKSAQAAGANAIVVAVPVAPPETADEIATLVDELVCLATPPLFEAVGQFYMDFSQTEDEQVVELLSKANVKRPS